MDGGGGGGRIKTRIGERFGAAMESERWGLK